MATHQDLSAYFFVKCLELYLKPTGAIAFVMPYAAMTRRQFEGFRSGTFGTRRGKEWEVVFASVQFSEAWAMSDEVQPLFPVPACVLFGRAGGKTGAVLPTTVLAVSGTLPRRDASPAEAEQHLKWQEAPWPAVSDDEAPVSPYRDAFHQGATIVPRMLSVVQRVPVGQLGENTAAPLVESRRTSQEKLPWKRLPGLRGNIEAEFLRVSYLGESIAPYRLLEPVLAVIPWDKAKKRLLDSGAAQQAGYLHLSEWLSKAEELWEKHNKSDLTFVQQVDYYGKLSAQFPIAPLRVIFTASGTLPAAAVLPDHHSIVEHKLYWSPVHSQSEADYLLAILNSETARGLVEHLQSRGQWGARDFDKVMFTLPIPRFDASNPLHKKLAKAAAHAEEVAATVPMKENTHFIKARQLIRAALQEDGIAAKIDDLVAQLLGSA